MAIKRHLTERTTGLKQALATWLREPSEGNAAGGVPGGIIAIVIILWLLFSGGRRN
jgi:hypothetical protein